MKYDPDLVKPMRKEVTRHGVEELRTREDVQDFLDREGTQLIFINSVCGCAGSSSRPALGSALEHHETPDHVGTVFAGQDREATNFVREQAPETDPSSPSFFLYRNGEPVKYIHRKVSKRFEAERVEKELKNAFEALSEETTPASDTA